MAAEFPAMHRRMRNYPVFFYSAIPFGWNGPPVAFCTLRAAIAQPRAQYGLANPVTRINHSFRPTMYEEDGIFVEISVAERLLSTTPMLGIPARRHTPG